MKRFFLLSLVAAFVSLMSVSAQDNTYSMIIKLANGTTLTIGPNEVDSISFNDGEITVAGSTINDLVAKITKAQIESQMRIDSLTNVVDRNAYEFMDMIARINKKYDKDLSNNEAIKYIKEKLYSYGSRIVVTSADLNAWRRKYNLSDEDLINGYCTTQVFGDHYHASSYGKAIIPLMEQIIEKKNKKIK